MEIIGLMACMTFLFFGIILGNTKVDEKSILGKILISIMIISILTVITIFAIGLYELVQSILN